MVNNIINNIQADKIEKEEDVHNLNEYSSQSYPWQENILSSDEAMEDIFAKSAQNMVLNDSPYFDDFDSPNDSTHVSDDVQNNLNTEVDQFNEEHPEVDNEILELSEAELENVLADGTLFNEENDNEGLHDSYFEATDLFDDNNVIYEDNLDVKPSSLHDEEIAVLKETNTTEKNFFEEADEGPIALSDEELQNALNETSVETETLSLEEDVPSIDLTDDMDGEFELSPFDHDSQQAESIDNLAYSSFTDLGTQSADTDFFEEADEGPIALSDDELQSALNETSDEEHKSTEKDFFEEADEGPIALSDEELQNALSETTGEQEGSGITDEILDMDLEDAIDDEFELSPIELDTQPEEKSFSEEADEGPVSLSDEELDHVFESTGSALEQDISSGKDVMDEDFNVEVVNDEISHENEETISSDNEGIENSHSIDTENELQYQQADENIQTIGDATNDVVNEEPFKEQEDEWEIEINPSDYKESVEKAKEILDSGLKTPPASSEPISDEEGKVHFYDESKIALPNRDELKKVVAYLDNLLGELPDELIEKFARSEYFKLYQKIMDDLGL